jgi:anthrone oxygenase-like protein
VRELTTARGLAGVSATLRCGVFFGTAAYISLVQQPAALQTGAEFATRFFVPMYGRASIMQAGLALGGTGTAVAAYWLGKHRIWLVSAVLIFIVIPFTLFVVSPVNQQLMSLDPTDGRALEILKQWGRLHWFRTLSSGASFVLCLVALGRECDDDFNG